MLRTTVCGSGMTLAAASSIGVVRCSNRPICVSSMEEFCRRLQEQSGFRKSGIHSVAVPLWFPLPSHSRDTRVAVEWPNRTIEDLIARSCRDMESHEHDLFKGLCLGVRLTGTESSSQLEALLEDMTEVADREILVSLQEAVADWLGISIDDCDSRLEASARLWSTVEYKGYSLVDVPARLRQMAFGDDRVMRRRAWRAGRRERLRFAAKTLAIKLAITLVVVVVVWQLLKRYVT